MAGSPPLARYPSPSRQRRRFSERVMSASHDAGKAIAPGSFNLEGGYWISWKDDSDGLRTLPK